MPLILVIRFPMDSFIISVLLSDNFTIISYGSSTLSTSVTYGNLISRLPFHNQDNYSRIELIHKQLACLQGGPRLNSVLILLSFVESPAAYLYFMYDVE